MSPKLTSLMHRLAHEGSEFFRAYGWETAAFHSFVSAGQRLKRTPPSTWPSEVMVGLEQSGIALLKRLDTKKWPRAAEFRL